MPLREPLPELRLIVTLKPPTPLPKLSWARTVTAGLIAAPAAVSVGCCTNVSVVAAAALTVNTLLRPVLNPLAKDDAEMRHSLLPGLINNLKLNLAQHAASFAGYHLGKTFAVDAAGEASERQCVAALLYGRSDRGVAVVPHGDGAAVTLTGRW